MMKKTMTILLAGILACSVTACGNAAKINLASDSNNVQQKSVGINKGITSENDISENDASEKNTTIGNTSEDTTSQSSSNDSSDHKTSEPGETSDLFTERDLDQSPDLSSAKTIVVADGETIDTEEGIYVIQGTATDCIIRVEAEEQSKVQLVLDGVNITNSDHSAIYVVSADKCFITTTNSNNILSVTGEFAGDDTTGDAVIYSTVLKPMIPLQFMMVILRLRHQKMDSTVNTVMTIQWDGFISVVERLILRQLVMRFRQRRWQRLTEAPLILQQQKESKQLILR